MLNKKRGFRIQARPIIYLVIVLLEIIFFIFSIKTFTETRFWINGFSKLISLFTIMHIINMRGDQSYKIMWIIFILIVPVFGVLAYLVFGGGRMFPHLKKRMCAANKKHLSRFNQSQNIKDALKYNDLMHFRQAEYLQNESMCPVYCNTESKFFGTGEEFLKELLLQLKKAEKFIYIEFYILAEGKMWEQIYEILKQKAKNNVEVKLIFDDFGSIKRQGKNFVNNLKNDGIEVSIFNPIKPSIDIFMNNRDHRKIVVIDGCVAFTGGVNIGDEYINKLERFGHWLDCGIMLKGMAVNTMTALFCSMWEFITGKELTPPVLNNYNSKLCNGFYIPYYDDPLNTTNQAHGIYMQIINNAQKYIYITTPYLILDNELKNALCLAAKSGIDVKIITPSRPDKWYVHPVTQYYYSELLENGVKIYEYTPGFIHSKIFVSDDTIATVGTINMDYRSLFLHFECGVWMSSANTVNDVKDFFDNTTLVSEEILFENWKKRPVFLKIKQYLLHLFAPLM